MLNRSFTALAVLFLFTGAKAAVPTDTDESKCLTSQKTTVEASLKAALVSTPQQKPAITACSQAMSQAYAACLKTVETSRAVSEGAVNAQGQPTGGKKQGNTFGDSAKLSDADAQANRTCSTKFSNMSTTCAAFPAAQGYANSMQLSCSNASNNAAANAQNLTQASSADDKLSDSSSSQAMPQMPQSSNSSPTNSPSSLGYQSSSMASLPISAQNSSASFSVPTSVTLKDPDGVKAMNSIGADFTAQNSSPFSEPVQTVTVPTEFKKVDAPPTTMDFKGSGGIAAAPSAAPAAPAAASDTSVAGTGSGGGKKADDAAAGGAAAGGFIAGGGEGYSPTLGKDADIGSGPGFAAKGSIDNLNTAADGKDANATRGLAPRKPIGFALASTGAYSGTKIGRIEPSARRTPADTSIQAKNKPAEQENSKGKLMMIPVAGLLLWAAASALRKYGFLKV